MTETPLRDQRCGNCVHATTTNKPTRRYCHREPTAALLASDTWPSMFYDDSCGYWQSPAVTP